MRTQKLACPSLPSTHVWRPRGLDELRLFCRRRRIVTHGDAGVLQQPRHALDRIRRINAHQGGAHAVAQYRGFKRVKDFCGRGLQRGAVEVRHQAAVLAATQDERSVC
jgi:hypothetical protein